MKWWKLLLALFVLSVSPVAMASKILVNTTAAPVVIGDTGQTVPSGGALTIAPTDYPAYAASSDTLSYIGAGTLVMNDGSTNLSVADGAALIQGLFPSVVGISDGTNTAAVKGPGQAPVNGDKALVVSMSPNSAISVTSIPPVDENLTGTITAACPSGTSCPPGSTVQAMTSGYTTFGYETHGTWSATLTTDVSYDPTCTASPNTVLWFNTASLDIGDNTPIYSTSWGSELNNDPWVVNVSGAQCARLRASAHTSGTVDVTIDVGVGTSVTWTVPVGNASSGSADSGAPIKVGGRYNATPPTFLDGQRGDLQLSSNGSLNVDVTNTVPVTAASLPLPSGAATAVNQSTQITSLTSIDGKTPALVSGRVPVDGSGVTQPVSAISLPLPTGAATAANQTTANSTLSAISGQLPTTLGSKVTASSVAVNVASDQVVPVSVSSLPLPSGAATSALQTTGNTSLASMDTKIPALVSGRAPVDGSGVTQPVSAASLPLPSGAATSANQTTANTTLSTISGQLPATLGQKTSANSAAVVIASDQSNVPVHQGDTSFIVSGLTATGSTPTLNPVSVSGVDGGGLKRHLLTDTGGRLEIDTAQALPLPSGAATSALQTTIDTDIKASQPRKLQDGSGNAVTSQASGGQRALDVGIDVAGTQVDPRQVRSLTSGTDAVTASQGGVWTVQQGGAPWSQNLTQVGGSAVALGAAATSASIPVTLPTDQASVPDLTTTGNITAACGSPSSCAAGTTVSVSTGGRSTASFIVTGTWNATLTIEGLNGSTWQTLPFIGMNTQAIFTNATSNGTFVVPAGGYATVRVRCSAFTSGTATVSAEASTGTQALYAIQAAPWSSRTLDSSGAGILSTSNALNVFSTNTTTAAAVAEKLTDGTNFAAPFQNVTGAQATVTSPGNLPVRESVTMGWDGTVHREEAVDTSGNVEVVGNVASGSVDSGAPVKVGGKFNTSGAALISGERADLQLDQFGNLATFAGHGTSFRHQASAATVTAKSGSGRLLKVCLNASAGNGHTMTIWDNTAASGTVIGIPTTSATFGGGCLDYEVEFATGLTYTTSSTDDWTVVYQ